MKTLARERDATEILERLARLRLDSVRRWGRMTVHQMICHLSDANRMATGERPAAKAATPLPPPLMRFVALYVPLRWPADIPTVPECDQAVGGTRPIEFAREVADVAGQLRRMADRGCRFGAEHPLLGTMSDAAWRRWGYLHTDHHLRQFGV